jgi:hypothetical protein
MLTYEIDGLILTLRATGTTTAEERQPVFDAVRADSRVPNGALVFLDVRDVDIGMGHPVVVERLRVLCSQLGPKLGPACAMLVTPAVRDQSSTFQAEAVGFGLRVNLFTDESKARHWLNGKRGTT